MINVATLSRSSWFFTSR